MISPLAQEWEIKSRAHQCARTQHPFVDGEFFYTLLFTERSGYRREDLCEEAWEARNDNIQPFSFWRTKYQAPAAAAPEAVPSQSAEDLLRNLMIEDDASHGNARFILAVMLERKKALRQIEAKETEHGRLLIYEHARTGEIFLIPDPQLRLDQIDAVQQEVGALLGAKPPSAPASQPEQPEQSEQPEQ